MAVWSASVLKAIDIGIIRTLFYLVFGCIALCMGVIIILWVLYNEFIDRRPAFVRPPFFGFFGIAPTLCIIGIYWLLKPFRKNNSTP